MAEKNIFAELDPIFHPRSVAILGASGKPGKIGHLFMTRFLEAGRENLYPVNPGEKEIMGVPAYPTVVDIPSPVDLAVVLTPTGSALQAVRECAAKGVKTIVITTAGFAEFGEKGSELQREMVSIARSAGCRIIGPNCIGIYCPSSRLPYPLAPGMKPGSVGLVSQSGFFADFITYRSTTNGINFSKAISCGNESDLTVIDFLEYLGEDPETDIVLSYVEGTKDGRRFFNACKEVSKRKPLILLKGGMTEGGARAAVSHTGAMAGSGRVWEGMMRQAGIVTVRSFEEALDCLHAFHLQPLPKGRRIGIASTPGGTAVATTDMCLELGLEVPKFSESTVERLREVMPAVGTSINNPADLSIASLVNPQIHGDAVKILAESTDVDMVLLISVAYGELLRDMIIRATSGPTTKKPVAVTVMAGTSEENGRDLPMFLSNGISVYPDPTRAARALAKMWEYALHREVFAAKETGPDHQKGLEASASVPEMIEKAQREGRTVLAEHESKELLKVCGIPVTREREARGEEEFRAALEEIGFPCALKVSGPAFAHKTEQGLVFLNIRSEQEARTALADMKARLGGEEPAVLVQEMVKGSRELAVGLFSDAQFGPCVMFGLGGIFTEALRDTTFRVAPVGKEEALDMIRSIRAGKMLEAFRGMSAADIDCLADIIVRIGSIGVNYPGVKEIDINPVILSGSMPVAVDALIVLEGKDQARPVP